MKIAMKCNQEQFDAVKDKLVGCELVGVGNFVTYDYLINYRFGNKNHITNYTRLAVRGDDAEIHTEWDEQLFLKACGIEPKQSYQYKSGMDKDWQNFPDSWKVRVKPNYSKEIAELERQIQELKNK